MLRIDKESNFIFRKSDYNCFCLIKITSSYFFCKSLHFLSYMFLDHMDYVSANVHFIIRLSNTVPNCSLH